MTVAELAEVLYAETPVEICLDYDLLYTGTAEDAILGRYANRTVEEAYISTDGKTLVISMERVYPHKNKV